MTVTIPKTGAELEELLLDGSRMKDLFKDDGSAKPEFGEFIKAYTDHRMAKDTSISQQIEDQVQAAMADMIANSSGRGRRPNLSRVGARNAPKRPGHDANDIFGDHGEFLQAIWDGKGRLTNSRDLAEKLGRLETVQNSYGTTIPADGGFLVPESFSTDIMTVALENSITRPRATVMPMTTSSLYIPAIDESSHSSSVYGGIICYWTEESGDLTESNAKFAKIKLEAGKLTAYALAPNELVQDAPAFLAWFTSKMPKAVAWSEDAAFIDGNGAGQPLGWLNSAAAVSVTKQTGQTADTIVIENLVKAYARMLPTSLSSAVWVASPDTFPELATMALSVGTGGSAVWLTNAVDGPPMTILGRPVYFSEKVPKLGDAGDINFVDLSYYGIGDRQAMRLEASMHYKFANDQTALRLIQRVDGRPMLLSAITPKNGGDTQSAFVKIAERA